MKTLKTIVAISFLFMSLSSCSNEEEKEAPLQNPLKDFLIAKGIDKEAQSFVNELDFEVGYSFTPLANGKITSLIVKIPDVRQSVRVTIWDKIQKTVLRTELIDVTQANTEISKEIKSVEVVKGTEYLISFNTNDYFFSSKKEALYPFTSGDILINYYAERLGSEQILPNVDRLNSYAGECNFLFQKTE